MWLHNRNKSIAACFGALLFIIFFSIAVSDFVIEGNDVDEIHNDITSEDSDDTVSGYCYWNFQSNSCKLTCSDGKSFLLSHIVEREINQTDGCDSIDLHFKIQNIYFPNNIVNEFWFKSDIEIIIFEFSLRNIISISTDAFATKPFSKTKSVIFTDSLLSTYQNGMLNGFNSLLFLSIISNSHICPDIGDQLLLSMGNTINEINITQFICPLKFLNWKNGSHLTELWTVDFSDNFLSDQINMNAFSNLEAVRTLNLSNSKITSIEAGSFDPIIKTIEMIDLTSNLLVTLPDLIFDKIGNWMRILLADNPWNCNCDLYDLYCSMIKYRRTFVGPVYCQNSCSNNKTIEELIPNCSDKYCKGGGIVADSRNNEIWQETKSGNFIHAVCYADSRNPNDVDLGYDKFIYLQRNNYTFEINIVSDDTVAVEINGTFNDIAIIWFNEWTTEDLYINPLSNQLNCLIPLASRTLIKGLQKNVPYIICIMGALEMTISPFDCIAHIIEPQFEGDPNIWINNDFKIIVISAAVVIFTLCVALGFSIGLVLIHRNPHWLGGEKTTKEPSRRDSFSEPSAKVIENNYIKMKHQTDEMYEQAIYPSQYDIIQERIARDRQIELEKMYLETLPEPVPPPLPPNHPSRPSVVSSSSTLPLTEN